MASTRSLHEKLWHSRIESPHLGDKYFIPNSDLDDHLVPENIRDELKATQTRNLSYAELSNYVTRIFETARRLFAILVLAERPSDIFSFIDEGIGDTDLPFVKEPPGACNDYKLCIQKHGDCPTRRTECTCEIRAMLKWSCPAASKLYTLQWQFLAPVFQKDPGTVPKYYFHDSIVLPFENNEQEHRKESGGFGDVWPVRIHGAHQKLLDATNPTAGIHLS
jgi:hypothetical protein